MMKKIITLILTTLLSVSAYAQERIAIIGAMDVEIEALVPQLKNKEDVTIANHKFYQGELAGKPVVITKSGVGKVNTAITATLLATKYDLKDIIFTGIAGACSPEVEPMDVVISTALVQHDVDLTAFNRPKGLLPGYTSREFLPGKALLKKAYQASISVLPNNKVHEGIIASGDQFIASKQKVSDIHKEFNAMAVEMEGAALGQVAQKFKIPYIVIRTISDKADGSAEVTYSELKKATADNSAKITLALLKEL
ncbi:5'-methylthioadenosine/adenosylhomocysteine nucleosidase [Vibrio salinus]|uniref:5'-methylthioadenosine/adenosylhomocysteine nucleosidase n=1 Tax=Vibrio salinus TaxID=2899784 RepID=UPI001E4221C1|nr:5'-methylthioadenosine/adenosylhomocysteine nucleosidase [Vibrio salinus]MCE0495558.1 5'-methylthioadenosine/adenosylhomocysteine nucleosidase [Vibrio salinus]